MTTPRDTWLYFPPVHLSRFSSVLCSGNSPAVDMPKLRLVAVYSSFHRLHNLTAHGMNKNGSNSSAFNRFLLIIHCFYRSSFEHSLLGTFVPVCKLSELPDLRQTIYEHVSHTWVYTPSWIGYTTLLTDLGLYRVIFFLPNWTESKWQSSPNVYIITNKMPLRDIEQ